jgi:hypothetical protein
MWSPAVTTVQKTGGNKETKDFVTDFTNPYIRLIIGTNICKVTSIIINWLDIFECNGSGIYKK